MFESQVEFVDRGGGGLFNVSEGVWEVVADPIDVAESCFRGRRAPSMCVYNFDVFWYVDTSNLEWPAESTTGR